jgi:hypothetical protein
MEVLLFIGSMMLVVGFFVAAAIAHDLGAPSAWGVAGGLALVAAVLVGLARTQAERDAIGTPILALVFVAPLALGAVVGSWLVLRNRR